MWSKSILILIQGFPETLLSPPATGLPEVTFIKSVIDDGAFPLMSDQWWCGDTVRCLQTIHVSLRGPEHCLHIGPSDEPELQLTNTLINSLLHDASVFKMPTMMMTHIRTYRRQNSIYNLIISLVQRDLSYKCVPDRRLLQIYWLKWKN